MPIKVIFQGRGELDSRIVEAPVDVPEAIVAMVMEAGELHPGDKIVVVEDESGAG